MSAFIIILYTSIYYLSTGWRWYCFYGRDPGKAFFAQIIQNAEGRVRSCINYCKRTSEKEKDESRYLEQSLKMILHFRFYIYLFYFGSWYVRFLVSIVSLDFNIYLIWLLQMYLTVMVTCTQMFPCFSFFLLF